jgi:hypothetical protein
MLQETWGISEKPNGTLDFWERTSRSWADKEMIKNTLDLLSNKNSMTAKELLVQRKQLDNMAWYDVAKTPEWRAAIRQVRWVLDKYMKDSIPMLKETDVNYADIIK